MGCLLWDRGEWGNSGYGRAWHGGRTWLAHRLAWTLNRGPIPDGLLILHKCGHRRAVAGIRWKNHLKLYSGSVAAIRRASSVEFVQYKDAVA